MNDNPDDLVHVDPKELTRDYEAHARSDPVGADEQLVQSVESLDRITTPIHARRIEGSLHVFDGWRRVDAAEEAGVEVPTLVYENLDRADALSKSLILNDMEAGVAKNVSDDDREGALQNLDANDAQARHELGIVSDADVLEEDLERVRGVGPGLCERLVENFGGNDEVHDATVGEIASTRGIGKETARAIHDELHANEAKPDGGSTVTETKHARSEW